jgi:hypothetical protein
VNVQGLAFERGNDINEPGMKHRLTIAAQNYTNGSHLQQFPGKPVDDLHGDVIHTRVDKVYIPLRKMIGTPLTAKIAAACNVNVNEYGTGIGASTVQKPHQQ